MNQRRIHTSIQFNAMLGPNHTTHAFSTFYCKYNLGMLQIIYLFYHKIKSNFIDIFYLKATF